MQSKQQVATYLLPAVLLGMFLCSCNAAAGSSPVNSTLNPVSATAASTNATISDNTYLYVGSGDGYLGAYSVTNGVINSAQLVFNKIASSVEAVAVSPNQKWLYTLSTIDHTLEVFRINPSSGVPEFMSSYILSDEQPNALSVSHDGDLVYVSGGNDGVLSMYSANQNNGKLSFITSTSGSPINSLASDPKGHFVYAGTATDYGILSYPINFNEQDIIGTPTSTLSPNQYTYALEVNSKISPTVVYEYLPNGSVYAITTDGNGNQSSLDQFAQIVSPPPTSQCSAMSCDSYMTISPDNSELFLVNNQSISSNSLYMIGIDQQNGSFISNSGSGFYPFVNYQTTWTWASSDTNMCPPGYTIDYSKPTSTDVNFSYACYKTTSTPISNMMIRAIAIDSDSQYAYVLGASLSSNDVELASLAFNATTQTITENVVFKTTFASLNIDPILNYSMAVAKPKPTMIQYTYILDNTASSINMYLANSDGSLVPLTPSAIQMPKTGASIDYMTISPDKQFMYVADDTNNCLYQFAIQGNGQLQYVATVASPLPNPTRLVFTPAGTYAYLTSDYLATESGVSAGTWITMYSVDKSTGMLTILSPSTIAVPTVQGLSISDKNVVIDNSGQYLYTADTGVMGGVYGYINLFHIQSDGQLVNVGETVPTYGYVQAMVISPKNSNSMQNSQKLYTAIVNINGVGSTPGYVAEYEINLRSGKLSYVNGFNMGYTPSSIVFSQDGQFAYVGDAVLDTGNTSIDFNSIYSFNIDSSSGSLISQSTYSLPPPPNNTNEIYMTLNTNYNFMYVLTEANSDQSIATNYYTTYSISESGGLTKLTSGADGVSNPTDIVTLEICSNGNEYCNE